MGVYTTIQANIFASERNRDFLKKQQQEIKLLKKKWWCKLIGGNLRSKVNCLRKY